MDHISMYLSQPPSPLISQLTSGINETTIIVRVTRAWKGISYYHSDEMVANFILLDKEDNQLLAVASNRERDRVWPKMYEGMLYFITNFKIVAAPTKWKPTALQKSLLFYHETRIDNCCKDINISTLKFDLRLLSTVTAHHHSTTTLIDVGGVVLQVHDLLYSSTGIEKLLLIIMDDSGVKFPIILWGSKASMFQVEFRLHRKVNAVFIITGLVVKNSLGHAHMASTPATVVHYNPEYKALNCLRHIVAKKYGEVICKVPIDSIHNHSNKRPIPKNIIEICQLHKIQELPKPQMAVCKVIILDLLPISDWKMDSCACCSRDVVLQDNTYYCSRCNKRYRPIIKRSMKTVVTDKKGTVLEFIIQPREIAQLIGISPLQLVSAQTNQKLTIMPTMKQINSIKETYCSFEVHYNQASTTYNNGEYVIKSIIQSEKFVKDETFADGHYTQTKRLRTQ